MTEFILFVIGTTVGFYAGWKIRELHAQRIVNKMFDVAQKQIDKNVINIDIIKENNHFYVYDSKTNAFIVQVQTKEELFKYFSSKFPEKTVMMKQNQLDLFDVAA